MPLVTLPKRALQDGPPIPAAACDTMLPYATFNRIARRTSRPPPAARRPLPAGQLHSLPPQSKSQNIARTPDPHGRQGWCGMDAASILNGTTLNPAQHAAATFGNGPLLIIAGAGTGKTNTLAHRVAYLIAAGINPSR